jgi:hypothetical protein
MQSTLPNPEILDPIDSIYLVHRSSKKKMRARRARAETTMPKPTVRKPTVRMTTA